MSGATVMNAVTFGIELGGILEPTNNHLSHLFIITKNVETATLAKLTYCGE